MGLHMKNAARKIVAAALVGVAIGIVISLFGTFVANPLWDPILHFIPDGVKAALVFTAIGYGVFIGIRGRLARRTSEAGHPNREH